MKVRSQVLPAKVFTVKLVTFIFLKLHLAASSWVIKHPLEPISDYQIVLGLFFFLYLVPVHPQLEVSHFDMKS